MTSPATIKVFISYSHDSEEHMNAVLNFANRLRREGVDCTIDQYVTRPREGWPRWCENQIEEAQNVLVVCTQTYLRRFQGKEEPGRGKGVTFEGYIITQQLYDAQGKNERFIPIVFGTANRDHIPVLLRGANSYDVSTQRGYDELYFDVTDQPKVIPPEVGRVRNRHSAPDAGFRALPALEAKREFGVRSNGNKPDRKWWMQLRWLAIIALGMVLAAILAYLQTRRHTDLTSSEIKIPPFEIMNGAELATGFDMGVNSALGMTDWVTRAGNQIKVAYPGSQAWGVVFVTLGPPGPAPHPSRDFSAYGSLTIDMRGAEGNETVEMGIRASTSPDDSSEMKIPVRLTQTWQTYVFQLTKFRGIDLKQLYVVAEFVFKGSAAETVYFRNIRYLNQNSAASPVTQSGPSNPGPGPQSSHPLGREKERPAPIADLYPSWERILRDLRSSPSHLRENIVKIEPLGSPEFAEKPYNSADPNSSVWKSEPMVRDDSYCRQLVELIIQSSDGNSSCHIEAALYERVGKEWRFQEAVRGEEGCNFVKPLSKK